MKTSMYFEQTLFYDPSSASSQLYDEKSGTLFEVNSENLLIGIHVQPPAASDDLQHVSFQSDAQWGSAPGAEVESICSSLSRASTLAADRNGYSPPHSPPCVGPPGLQFRRIWDPRLLRLIAEQCSTWVLIAASGSAEARLEKYIKTFDSLAGLNPFEIHLIIFDTALANWRPRIVDLTEKVTAQVCMLPLNLQRKVQFTNPQSARVLMASMSAKGPPLSLDNEERQELKDIQDQIIDILVVLDSILDVIAVMIEKYNQFSHNIDTPLENPTAAEFDPIQIALREKQQEAQLSKKKVEALHMKIQGTISLLSDLLSLGTGHSLQRLAEEARQENIATRGFTEKATRDAAAVKVLTIITLIYLPATVVSVSHQ
ncbi:MAG: hypothetical protein Q9187_003855 [Circinaria calcarea]